MSRCASKKRRGRGRPRLQQKRKIVRRTRPRKVPIKAPPPPATRQKTTSLVWENIVLHYLNKLKSAWKSKSDQPAPIKEADLMNVPSTSNIDLKKMQCSRTKSDTSTLRCPPNSMRYSKSQNSLLSLGSDSYNIAKRKAINIVRNAIEYGQSKGIISKNGKFFWLKDDMKRIPEPENFPSDLRDTSQCNAKKKPFDKTRPKSRCSSSSPSSISKQSSKHSNRKNYRKAKSLHPNVFTKRKLRAHFEDDSDEDEECTCSRCKCNMYY